MSVANLNTHDVEQDRQRQAQELAEDSGPGWVEEYLPGTAGCHELLDRTALMADMLQQHLLAHPACIARAEWYLLAEHAVKSLLDLYQKVGAEHLTADTPD